MNDLESRLRAALHDETAELAARPELADDMVAHGATVRRRRRIVGSAAGLVVLAAIAVPAWQTVDLSSTPVAPAHSPIPTSVTQSPPTTPAPTTPTAPKLIWTTRAVDKPHAAQGSSRIVNLRVGRHGSYDRVVVDIEGSINSYSVGYVPVFIPPEGDPQPLAGTAVLALRLTSATTHDNRGRLVYLGNRDETYSLPSVLASTYSDFEGHVDFGLGLTNRARFRVFELSSPTRIVVDIHH